MSEEWLTSAEVAAHLGITPQRVRWLLRNGRLPAERELTPRGAVWWVKAADLAAYTPLPAGRPFKTKKETVK